MEWGWHLSNVIRISKDRVIPLNVELPIEFVLTILRRTRTLGKYVWLFDENTNQVPGLKILLIYPHFKNVTYLPTHPSIYPSTHHSSFHPFLKVTVFSRFLLTQSVSLCYFALESDHLSSLPSRDCQIHMVKINMVRDTL